MKIIKAIYLKTFTLNIIIYIISSAVITFISEKLPDRFYNYKIWILREREWEKKGEIYERLLRIKKWKKYAFELSDFIKSVFPKKDIKEYSVEYLSKYLLESCRAELTHWAIISSSLLFWLFNDFKAFLNILVISIVLNLPFIIIQRYNRPRIIQMIKHLQNASKAYILINK